MRHTPVNFNSRANHKKRPNPTQKVHSHQIASQPSDAILEPFTNGSTSGSLRQPQSSRSLIRNGPVIRLQRGRKMLIKACIAKIHRATVTQADLNYVGSITIDQDLLDASGMLPFQYVNITNIRSGMYWRTYIIAGEPGSGVICLNGTAAHHFQPLDLIIILAEASLEPSEMKDLNPVVVFVDGNNKITEVVRHRTIPLGTSR